MADKRSDWWPLLTRTKEQWVRDGFDYCLNNALGEGLTPTPPDFAAMKKSVFAYLQKYFKINDKRFDTPEEFWKYWEWKTLPTILADLCDKERKAIEARKKTTPVAISGGTVYVRSVPMKPAWEPTPVDSGSQPADPQPTDPGTPADPTLPDDEPATAAEPTGFTMKPWMWAVLGGIVLLFILKRK